MAADRLRKTSQEGKWKSFFIPWFVTIISIET